MGRGILPQDIDNNTGRHMEEKTPSLLEDFQEYFGLELALTPEQMELVYRIRYRVYCEEFGYESSEDFPGQQEMDEFDSRSVHCLVTHKQSGMPAGCIRLVKIDDGTLMPMEKYCSESFDAGLMKPIAAPRTTMCEFSRLAVDGAFRRRAGERYSRFGKIDSLDCSKREKRTFSLIAAATFLAAFAVSDLIGRPNCFAMMEPFLPRLLNRSGIAVKRMGVDIDYHGTRAPYYIATQDAVSGMPADLLEFYNTIHGSFSQTLSAAANRGPHTVAVREHAFVRPFFWGASPAW